MPLITTFGAASSRGYDSGTIIIKDGSSPATAAVSAASIKTQTGTNTDGTYWIDLPTVGPTLVYCLMNSSANGGGWMLAMKSTRGTTFNYRSE